MTTRQATVLFSKMNSWQKSVPALLDACGLGKKVAEHETVLIKPNLVETLAPPITTPVSLVEAIVDYLLNYLTTENIVIAEGCGSTSYDTFHAFDELGYTRLAQEKGIQFLDLNIEKLVKKRDTACRRWPEMYLPEILDRVFLISVPVLKAHSLAGVTLTMKNMMGCAPPAHYQGQGGWAKASFHAKIHEAIFDLNRYRTPDFTVLDGTVGMAEAHLWGPQCIPPVGKIAASFDPVAIDTYGSSLLKRKWQDIDHIRMAHGVLGMAEPLNIEEID